VFPRCRSSGECWRRRNQPSRRHRVQLIGSRSAVAPTRTPAIPRPRHFDGASNSSGFSHPRTPAHVGERARPMETALGHPPRLTRHRARRAAAATTAGPLKTGSDRSAEHLHVQAEASGATSANAATRTPLPNSSENSRQGLRDHGQHQFRATIDHESDRGERFAYGAGFDSRQSHRHRDSRRKIRSLFSGQRIAKGQWTRHQMRLHTSEGGVARARPAKFGDPLLVASPRRRPPRCHLRSEKRSRPPSVKRRRSSQHFPLLQQAPLLSREPTSSRRDLNDSPSARSTPTRRCTPARPRQV
jgi:hypothetical protein